MFNLFREKVNMSRQENSLKPKTSRYFSKW